MGTWGIHPQLLRDCRYRLMATVGTNVRVEITTQLLSADPPRDWCTNTLSFNTASSSVSAAQYQALTDAIKGVWFATSGTGVFYGSNGGKVIAYNRADPLPRVERGVSLYTPGTWQSSQSNPRQLCTCVSFYSFRNLKRQRGRIYLAWNNNYSPSGERLTSPYRTSAVNTIKNIYSACAALTPVWLLTVHSDVVDTDFPVDHAWCNDIPDTQRRRSPKEAARTLITIP